VYVCVCTPRDHDRRIIGAFMLFMVVGSYLMMNLFVGVILENFNMVKDRAEGGISMLTEEQQVGASANDAHRVTWFCIQKQCSNIREGTILVSRVRLSVHTTALVMRRPAG
jgi:hypothetical protein